jgi:hypothetical protein
MSDPRLDATWRKHSTELPPAHLDAAILAAAHREVKSKPRAAGDDDALAEAREPARWWWGLAAAATIGVIAFGVVQLAPPVTTPSETATVASDTPPAQRVEPQAELKRMAPAPAAPAPVVPAPASKPAEPPAAKPAPAPRAFPGTAPSQLAKTERDVERRRDEAPAVAAAPAPAQRALGATSNGADVTRESAQLSPEAWVERIRAHYEAQRFDAAAEALRAFRRAYPDADERLPPSLQGWARTIRAD